MLQGLSLQIFHVNEGLALVLLNSVDSADVGMVERRGGAGLPLKTLQRLTIPGKFFRQEFERYEAAELGVLGLIDHTHPSAAQLLNDAVVGNGLTNHARNQPLRTILGRACS